jgi:glycosyltransferase involved in cell wall biosynthesis
VRVTLSWYALSQEIVGRAIGRPEGIDLIHANTWHAAAFADSDIPLVATAHTESESPRHDAHKTLFRRLYHASIIRPRTRCAVRLATTLTAVSSTVARAYAELYDARNVRVIGQWAAPSMLLPNAVDTARKPVLLFAGRPGWHKGSDLLPAIAEAIKPWGVLACTLTADQWPGETADHVRCLGPLSQEALWAEMRGATALVVPSRSEGFGLVALEAMGNATPVIGFAGVGLEDVTGDAGYLVPVGDVEAIARRFSRLVCDASFWRQEATAARMRVQEEFSEIRSVGRYIALYEQVLQRRSGM